MNTNAPRFRKWTGLFIILTAIVLIPFALFGEAIDAWTQSFLQQAGDRYAFTALVLMFLLVADVFLPVPSCIVSTACGILLGFTFGSLVSTAGMTLGCWIGYGFGKKLGRSAALRWMGADELQRLDESTRRYGNWMVVLLRPIPVLAEASTFYAGMGKMPSATFMAFALLSNAFISVLYAGAGAYAATVNSILMLVAAAIIVPAVVVFFCKQISASAESNTIVDGNDGAG